MKTTVRILSVLLSLCLIMGLTFSASAYHMELVFSAADYESEKEVSSVMTYENGTEQTFPFAPDIEALDVPSTRDNIESVEVFVEDESVLTLGVKTYYTAEFALPDTQKTVFLTGLSVADVSELERKIIEGCQEGSEKFSIEDLSFIDAEKRRNTGDGDDNLCWAAAASNLLIYTGWADQAGFETSDDVFEAFIDGFTDAGGSAEYGIGWFFNGVDTFYRTDTGATHVRNYGSSGAYLTDYCYNSLVTSGNIYDDFTRLSDVMALLKEGYGVGLSVKLFLTSTGSYLNGHAVTMWGYVTNDAYTPDQAGYYDMLIITDSDSNELWNTDRRESKNELDLYRLTYTETPVNTRYPTRSLSYSDGYNTAVLYTYNTLMPYSEDIARETSSKATKDMTSTQDLAITSCYLSSDITDESFYNRFDEGDDIFFSPILSNVGDYRYSGSAKLRWVLYDESGRKLDSETFNVNMSIQLMGYTYYPFAYRYFMLSGLDTGKYTLTMSFNADESVTEAYFYNNTYSVVFTVGDVQEPTEPVTEEPSEDSTDEPTGAPTENPAQTAYLLGDADGDDDITVLDATLIQRVLAGVDRDEDGLIHLRGDVYEENDMTVLSATLIQRYLAGLDRENNIGQTRYY